MSDMNTVKEGRSCIIKILHYNIERTPVTRNRLFFRFFRKILRNSRKKGSTSNASPYEGLRQPNRIDTRRLPKESNTLKFCLVLNIRTNTLSFQIGTKDVFRKTKKVVEVFVRFSEFFGEQSQYVNLYSKPEVRKCQGVSAEF